MQEQATHLLCGTILCLCLQVQYTALPHYEDKFEDFKADTVVLRRRFTPEGELHTAERVMDRDSMCLV